ncbi:MAG TPA: DUF3667 domain-containing protein [Sphingomicrobium sp.]
MGEFEAVADAVTGGVVGRALEHKAGEGDGHTHEGNCLNCGAPLAGPFCHECGQHAHVHRTLEAFFHDFLHGVLHFEGKIWRTLPLLAWKPGELTRRYIDGQRASFVSPIALFLFSVFLMFAVVGLTSTTAHVSAKASADAARELNIDQQRLAILQKQRASATGPVAASLDEQISDLKREMVALTAVREGKIDASFQFAGDYLGGLGDKLASKNPELLFYKIKTNAYKFSWALIPISVPFVWLLFPFNRRFRLYDHTVFVTYSLCFMMLLLAAASLVGLVSDSVASLAWFVPPVHMYRQLRGTYDLSKRGALWRTALLTIFAFIAIGLFGSLLVTLGAFD